jgi:hypothetical protein
MPVRPFKRLILRAVLRDVYPTVIRLVAVPDSLDLIDFDDIFHAVIDWDSGFGFAFQISGSGVQQLPAQDPLQKVLRLPASSPGEVSLHPWRTDGAEGDETPVCVVAYRGLPGGLIKKPKRPAPGVLRRLRCWLLGFPVPTAPLGLGNLGWAHLLHHFVSVRLCRITEESGYTWSGDKHDAQTAG